MSKVPVQPTTLDETINVNRLWFVTIVSECVLNFNTGLKHSRSGSPFARLRDKFPIAPKNKAKCLVWLKQTLVDNKMNVNPSLEKACHEIETNGKQAISSKHMLT